ncbi:MAG: hypothetical protein V4576_00540 [Patescibacteria group bacterium]
MTDLEFNDSNNLMRGFKSRAILGQPETPGMINFLIRKGIVKSQNQAYYILVGIMIFCFGLAIALPFMFGTGGTTISAEQQKAMETMQTQGNNTPAPVQQ